MPRFRNPLLPLFLLLLFLARPARAHDALASTGNLWVRQTGIDVELYMARAAGTLLIAKEGETISLSPDNFATYQPRLQPLAPTLLTLTTADGTTLKPDAVSVSITDENDICFTLHYPLPKNLPTPLKIHAGYLAKMAEGHVGNLYAMNARGDDLGWGEVRPESPDLDARLPAASALPAPRRATTTAATTPAPSAATQATPASLPAESAAPPSFWLLITLGIVFLFVTFLGIRILTRKHPSK